MKYANFQKNFTAVNTRKISVALLHCLLFHVIKSRGDHARVDINRPQLCRVICAFERKKNWVNLVCPTLMLLLAILRVIFGDENLEKGILTLYGSYASSASSLYD